MKRWLIGFLLLTCSAAARMAAVALTEDSLNDMKKLPQFRHYLQHMSKSQDPTQPRKQQQQQQRHPHQHPIIEDQATEGSAVATWATEGSGTSDVATPPLTPATWDAVAALENDDIPVSPVFSKVTGGQEDGTADSRHGDKQKRRKQKKDPQKKGTGVSVSDAKKKLAREKRKKLKKIRAKDQQQTRQADATETMRPSSTRLKSISEQEAASEAQKHLRMMSRPNAKCNQPSARLVDVRHYHEDKSDLLFFPRCTWLHRCSDDVGCCLDVTKACRPLETEIVSLYFFAQSIGHEDKLVVKLDFDNHTQCGCQSVNGDLMPRTEEVILGPRNRYYGNHGSSPGYRTPAAETEGPHGGHMMVQSPDDFHPGTWNAPAASGKRHFPAAFSSADELIRPADSQCRCPSQYVPRDDGECHCDCGSRTRSHPCYRLKRGLQTFSLRDRGCISDGKCHVPGCQYGRYITTLGRCAKRDEQDAHWLKLVV